MTERELREKLQFAYGTMPDATHAAFEHSLTHHRVKTRHPVRMSRRMRTIVTLALMLMMLTAVGVAAAKLASVTDYPPPSGLTPEYMSHLVTLNEAYDGDLLTLSVNDLVFDGTTVEVAMNVQPKAGKQVFMDMEVTAECAGVEFIVKGSVIRQAGWRAVYGKENGEENNSQEETAAIPCWQEGDTLALKAASITEGKTKPKPLHTEATLLSAMETAGKEIEDDALRQALKDCGIGTPATRAAIIETLFKRGYMERCKKSLVPTEKGLALYSVVKTMRIADVALTGEWEKELARIERGELSAETFRKEIEAYTREITSELLSCDKLFSHKDSGCACPKCGTGRMQFYGKVVRCDNAECGLPVFRLKANRTLSDDEIKDLLTDGHTKLLKGFKSKQGKSFDAIVAFDGEFNTTFVFPERKTSKKFSGRKK